MHDVTTTGSPGLAGFDDPFVRHQVDPERVGGVWTAPGACVVSGGRGPLSTDPPGPVFTCLGDPGALGDLMAEVAAAEPVPWRISVEAGAADRLPSAWAQASPHEWHWMITGTRPEPQDDVRPVAAAEANALLDVAHPDSWARPGVGRDAWFGIDDPHGDALVATGAIVRMHDGTGHLRGIAVHPDRRGRGLGVRIAAGLTHRAMDEDQPVATLGVFTDNVAAVAAYHRVGYVIAHTFRSGVVAAFSA